MSPHCNTCGRETNSAGNCPVCPPLHTIFLLPEPANNTPMDKVLYDMSKHIAWHRADAARSERERAARVCDEQVAASRAMGEPSGLAELCRNRIRSLPDDNALGAEGAT